MPIATAAARDLKSALGPDVAVFASARGRGPVLTVLRLVSAEEASSVRPTLEDLVAGFRRIAGALVEQMRAGASPEDDCPDSVRYGDATWYLDPHGEHCRFENAVSGEVVEANIYAPDALDPYFLLEYAKSAGHYGVVVDACVEGFHDMCRLLDQAGIAYG
ncbi:hypothetical protein GCM10010109_31940 [Actinoplanes campanulatus]|nr:hypothetical protein GCM10010109_31940 [Actinoplanes campanulatus]GID38442.1 hypothetical protein Aca09nite_49480 [Actinoplanes campanulatus]